MGELEHFLGHLVDLETGPYGRVNLATVALVVVFMAAESMQRAFFEFLNWLDERTKTKAEIESAKVLGVVYEAKDRPRLDRDYKYVLLISGHGLVCALGLAAILG